jgi:hypothetical protein
MLHWDQMSFLRERGEKILAKKQTLETTMDMEVAHTLPWRWTINAVVAAMTILLLLSCVALCVCARFFWLQLAGLSIRMSSETHTHNYRSITGCARFPTRRLRRFQNLPSVGARETDLAFLEISSNGSFHLPRLPGLNGDDYNDDDHCIGKTNKTKKIPTAFFIIASDFVFSRLISSGFSSYRFESSAQRRTSHLHDLGNEEVARVDSVFCAYNSVVCCFAKKASKEGERREVERVAISE